MLDKVLTLVLLAGVASALSCGSNKQVCMGLMFQKVVSTFYVYLKDPSAVDESAIAKELFNPKVFLSVVPVGTFEGPGPVLEYLTTFVRKSPMPLIANLPTPVKIRQLVLVGNFFMVQFDMYVTNPDDESYNTTLRGTAFVTFDSKTRVKVITIDFSTWHDTFGKLNYTATITPDRVAELQNLLCTIQQTYCLGPNKQYDSVAECKAFLATIPALPPVYRLAGNNLMCRVLHARYVDADPTVHCPHIGRTGGGKCVDDPLPYAPSQTDKYIPIGTFFSAPAGLAPTLKQLLNGR